MRLYCKEKAALSLRKHCEYAKNPAFGKEDLLPKAGFACSGPAKGKHGKKAWSLKGEGKIKNAFLNKISNPAEGNKTQTNKPVIAC